MKRNQSLSHRSCLGWWVNTAVTVVKIPLILGSIAALLGFVIININGDVMRLPGGSESKVVQVAIYAMMADQGATMINGLTSPAKSTNRWTSLPTGRRSAPLSSYLNADHTSYFYCYDSSGKITARYESAEYCP